MIEYKTASQCISSDYCKGWNDAVKKAEKENKKLRAMLKIVAKDISSFKTFLAENNCRLPCEKCLFYNCGRDKCEYMHMPEIIKLIGDDE